MFYTAVSIIAGVVVGLSTKGYPEIAARIGLAALSTTLVGVGFALLTGTLAAFYLGAFAFPFGLTVITFCIVGALRRS